MPRITAVLHTQNDALRLGRCLETLYPCDEILVVDHGSKDATLPIARQYAARVMKAQVDASAQQYIYDANAEWVLCLDAHESLTEALAASLYQWKLEPHAADAAFSIRIREETVNGWIKHHEPQIRMVPANWTTWNGPFPTNDSTAQALEGEILRFVLP